MMMACAINKNEVSCSYKSNLAGPDEYDARFAQRVWGFKPIPFPSKLQKNSFKLLETTKKTVIHNLETLKNLPSKIKLSIIRKCVKNSSDDFVGFTYTGFYVPCHFANQENQMVKQDTKRACKKRACVEDEDYEELKNVTPHKKKKNGFYVPCRFANQENQMMKQDTKRACKKRVLVEDEDYKDEDYVEEENNITPPKKKKNTESIVVASEPIQATQKVLKPAPNLSDEIKERIERLNGRDIKWVMTKTLYSTDVKPGQNRFSMPLKQIDNSFLRDDEEAFLSQATDNEKNRPGITVRLVGHTGHLWTVTLKKWKMDKGNDRCNFTYNLIGNWCKDVVVNDRLKEGQKFEVWSFREGSDLAFALQKLEH